MKFTLKDYQDEAVRDVLANLKKARKRWREDRDPASCSYAQLEEPVSYDLAKVLGG